MYANLFYDFDWSEVKCFEKWNIIRSDYILLIFFLFTKLCFFFSEQKICCCLYDDSIDNTVRIDNEDKSKDGTLNEIMNI